MTATSRVYTEKGVLSHLVQGPVTEMTPALCGRSPWPQSWLGARNQEEHEMASATPLCMSCLRSWSRAYRGVTR